MFLSWLFQYFGFILLAVIDSSSYFITGFLHGNFAELGNFDECLRSVPPGEENKYFSLYSLVEIEIQKSLNSSQPVTKSHLLRAQPDTFKWRPEHQGLKLTKDGDETQEVSDLNL